MASKYSEDQFEADSILLEEIYEFAGYNKSHLSALRKAVRQGDLSMESIVENAIAKVGKLTRVDLPGMDFSDGSDAKKVTVVNQGTKLFPIMGAKFSTKNKKGLLRVVVVDPQSEEIFYFRIPPEFYLGKQKHRQVSLTIKFDILGGPPSYGFFNRSTTSKEIWNFRVQTFEELCA